MLRWATLLIPIAVVAQRPIPIDNAWARVVVATSAPGPKGRMHKHDVNRVMVYLDKGAQQLEHDDGSKREISFAAGEVKWDPKGGMHTSENRGGTTFRVIEIELKKEGGRVIWPASDPVTVAPNVYRVEFENDQVRVLRARLAPRQKVDIHEHALPRIVLPLTPVDLRIVSREGGESSLKAKPGDAIFGPGVSHREENLMDAPVELILVELKGT